MATIINNLANISYKYGTLTDTAVSNVATTSLSETFSLTASKTSNNSNWRPQENLTYNIRIENTGVEPLYDVSIQDNLGGNPTRLLTYIADSARMFRNGVLTNVVPTSTSPLTLVIPETLEAGEIVVFTYVAKVITDIDSSINEITNEVTVVGHETSITGPTITVTPVPSLTLPKADYASVRITKSVDKDTISRGDTLTYTFELENSGNIEATNVVIKDSLPQDFEIQSIVSETNGVQTVFETTDYSLNADNELVLPTSVTKTISVPAAIISGNGLTTVTIVGTITD